MTEQRIVPDEDLSPEDLQARKKGLALIAHIEADKGLLMWYQKTIREGMDEIAEGHGIDVTEDVLRAWYPHKRLHEVRLAIDLLSFHCAVCGGKWLFNPHMFRTSPDPEKHALIFCPGEKEDI